MSIETVLQALITKINTSSKLDIYYDAEQHDDAPALENITGLQGNIASLAMLDKPISKFMETSSLLFYELKHNSGEPSPELVASWLQSYTTLAGQTDLVTVK